MVEEVRAEAETAVVEMVVVETVEVEMVVVETVVVAREQIAIQTARLCCSQRESYNCRATSRMASH